MSSCGDHNAPMEADNPNTDPHEVAAEERWNERHELLYHLNVDLRYYRKREWFFDKCDKLVNFATILGGMAVFASLQKSWPALGALIAALGALPLVFSFSDQRHTYRALAEQACAIITNIEQHVADADITEDWLKSIKGMVGSLSAKEPPTLGLLALVCEREEQIASAKASSIPAIGGWHRLVAHFGNWPIPSKYLPS